MASQRLRARVDELRELVVARMEGVLNSLRREEVPLTLRLRRPRPRLCLLSTKEPTKESHGGLSGTHRHLPHRDWAEQPRSAALEHHPSTTTPLHTCDQRCLSSARASSIMAQPRQPSQGYKERLMDTNPFIVE